MRALFSIVGIFLFGVAVAKDLPDANPFFEAGRYDKVVEIYETVLKGDISREQRRVAEINIGIAKLAGGKLEEAAAHLEGIVLGDDPSPFYVEHLKSHLAEVYLLQAKQLVEEKKIEEGIEKVSGAMEALDSCFSAVNERLVLQGDPDSAPPQYLQRQRLRAKSLMTALLALRREQAFELQSAEEHILDLVMRLERVIGEIESVAFAKASKENVEEQQNRWAAQLKKDDNRWRLLREEFDQQELFLEAERETYTAMDLLREERHWDARTSLAKAENLLEMLYYVQKKEDALGPQFQRRLVLARKKAATAKESPLYPSLQEESGQLTVTIAQLLSVLKKQFEEENKVEEVAALAFLQKRQGQEIPREEDAYFDLIWYSGLNRRVGQVLRDSYSAFRDQVPLEKSFLLLRVAAKRVELQPKDSDDVQRLLNEALALETIELKAEDKASQAANLIEKALMIVEPKELLQAKFEELLKEYMGILKRRSLSEKALLELQKREVALSALMAEVLQRGVIDESLLRNLENISSDNSEAMKQLKRRRDIGAKLFLEDAKLWVQRALDSLSENRADTPVKVLEKAVQEERTASRLTSIARDIPDESLETAVKNLLASAQIPALSVIKEFEEVASQMTENWEEALKQPPWPEVLHLVQQGREAADRAEKALWKTVVNLRDVFDYQSQAIEYWEKALEALKPPEEEKDDEGSGGSGTEEEPSPQEDSPSGEGEEASAQLQLLQQMEQDDEGLKEHKMTTPKRGLRPW